MHGTRRKEQSILGQGVRQKTPCKGCTERVAGCHSVCERYKEWKIEWERERDERKASIKARLRTYPAHISVKGTKIENYLET